ncbi:thiamine biosynthesis protein ThiS [Acidihalobacter yilgarnensis]|uniref:Thiamine biosynthesis protein ThiS n=1 Tax=Acidihalobacter yilgarnensis TaxID=2819280 RepID=A0A1D8IRR2_9GAMM|nr:sulfur carrier protein ThiS [Acidihalobacter yilgarnensis]AOU99085.1 thiamine biosynthesis protein ThiS [Acidihalobacter yilgarnensis]
MQIILNGQTHEVPDGLTARELVALLELEGRRLALEVNEEVLPRSRFDEYRLDAQDRVEIVHAIGGG